jgi:mRNA (guanine-N7-)-methyltransferase
VLSAKVIAHHKSKAGAEANSNGAAAEEEDDDRPTFASDDEDDWDPEKSLDSPKPHDGEHSEDKVKEKQADDKEDGQVEEEGFEWGNSVYRVKFPGKTPADGTFRPPFGWKYFYFLEEAVDEVPEYVVPWEAFRALAEDYNLELQYRKPFREVWEEQKDDRELGKDERTRTQWGAIADFRGGIGRGGLLPRLLLLQGLRLWSLPRVLYKYPTVVCLGRSGWRM